VEIVISSRHTHPGRVWGNSSFYKVPSLVRSREDLHTEGMVVENQMQASDQSTLCFIQIDTSICLVDSNQLFGALFLTIFVSITNLCAYYMMYDSKSLFPLGKIGYIDHIVLLDLIKDHTFRDILLGQLNPSS